MVVDSDKEGDESYASSIGIGVGLEELHLNGFFYLNQLDTDCEV